MGNRLIKTLPGADGMGSDTEPSHMLREIAGEVMLSGGYDAFLEILKTKGDESEYNKVINEQKEFYAYREQRMAERIKQQLGHR